MINSLTTYKNSQGCLKERAIHYQLGWVGGGATLLLSKYHHNVNLIAREDLSLNEGVLPPFVDALHSHAQWLDPQFAIMIGSSWCSSRSVLASFSHRCYEGPN
jgi:hypothetical protein